MASSQPSQKEIWDDSALVDSWNEALEEYKYYHSMHARGEKVEAIIREAEEQEMADPDFEEGQADDQPVNDHRAKNDGAANPASNQTSGNTPEKGPAVPQHLIGQVHDESLKNLLMSWYYAGYYTGLYEGQQQGAAGKQA